MPRTAGGHRRRDDRDRQARPLRAAHANQFEKPEATFFNLEFPHNNFHLRHPLFEPLPVTLPEPEIWARLVWAVGAVDDAELQPLRHAAREGPWHKHVPARVERITAATVPA